MVFLQTLNIVIDRTAEIDKFSYTDKEINTTLSIISISRLLYKFIK